MKEVLLALLAGIIIGILFNLVKLPLSAPPIFAEVAGIVGVYFDDKLVELILLKIL
ncbi:XapX domain-containing protein [Geobacillus thermodenitrificans]|uniref:XapX domain-containing protein n=1 Tax=Geobacillus thermodenitrificans TaxID=33940 RepID=UPI002E230D00|nr:XapX domain-containing protein [Geobacillus thermodenitrificans]MED3716506.1 XapX domain-containing protein [Geobacillus thermodenitrificans]